MSTLLAPPRPPVGAASDASAPPELARTLDDVVARTWEVLRAGLPAACLVCGDELDAPERCAGCGAALS